MKLFLLRAMVCAALLYLSFQVGVLEGYRMAYNRLTADCVYQGHFVTKDALVFSCAFYGALSSRGIIPLNALHTSTP